MSTNERINEGDGDMPRKVDRYRVNNHVRLRAGTSLEWTKDAACAGVVGDDPELDAAFFPEVRGRHSTIGTPMTRVTRRQFCDHCPVIAECFNFAIKNEYVGLWGGQLVTHQLIRTLSDVQEAAA